MKKILLSSLTAFLFVTCVTTGPGGQKSLVLIPTDSEVEIGKEVVKEVESTEKVLNNNAVQSYVNTVGQKIAKICDRRDVKYTFKVLDSDEINAFACPGGYIYIYSGLMKIMDNEAQLAAVLAHEVGHVVARHSMKRLQAVYGYSLVMEIALGDKMGKTARTIVDASAGLILQGYGRENEYEADNLGVLYEKKAGYNPNGMVQLFTKFKQMEGNPPNALQKLLASHPPASDRIGNAKKKIQEVGGTDLPYKETEYAAIKAQL